MLYNFGQVLSREYIRLYLSGEHSKSVEMIEKEVLESKKNIEKYNY